ncbi:MAG: DUF433 domain-containing protein [Verrucomicrobiota bacterium]
MVKESDVEYDVAKIARIPIKPDNTGTIRVGGTRVTLETVVGTFIQGATAEEISLRYPTLALSDIYHVVGYYLVNKEEVDTYMAEQEAKGEAVRGRIEARYGNSTGLRDRLLARQRARSSDS